jgi:2-isopropylmalate synthase
MLMGKVRETPKIPEDVMRVSWWERTRKENFRKIAPYAEGFVTAFTEPNMEHMRRVRLLDTTPRDGMQMSHAFVPSETSPETIRRNKLVIIGMLAQMGVPVIEAGFAAASEDEQAIIRTARINAREAGHQTRIVALGRAVKGDIDAIVRSEADIAHIFSSGSPMHTWVKFGKSPKDTIPDIEEAVRYAVQCGFGEIIVSLEDAPRSDPDHLVDVGRRIRDIAGERVRYNIPDTVGVADPVLMFGLISKLRAEVGIPLQVHCHNDRGLAEINSIAAAIAGAEDIHVTMHGMGERAGNAALEVVAGYFKTQFGIDMIDLKMLPAVSEVVEARTGIERKINAPYVGRLCGYHESGVHCSAVMKGVDAGFNGRPGIDGGSVYSAFNLLEFGREEEIGIGPVSGVSNVVAKMAKFGVDVSDKVVAGRIIGSVKERVATTPVSDADLALMSFEAIRGVKFEKLAIRDCRVSTCMSNGSEATVEIVIDGRNVQGTGHGNGPIDAAIDGVLNAIGRHDIKIGKYDSVSVGSGSDAAARCTVSVDVNGQSIVSSEIHTNTVMAAVRAFEKGFNAIHAIEEMKG